MSFALDNRFDEARPMTSEGERTAWIVFGFMVGLLVLAYGNMLWFTSTFWSDGLYSHGWIVPLIAAYLLWIRRRSFVEPLESDRWIGVAVLVASQALRVWASVYDFNIFDRLSFIGSLLATTLIVGGRHMLAWAGPALAFLLFMFPLPSFFENTLLMSLQTVASKMSTFVLQLLGVGAARAGNVISIDTMEDLTVAEACSGLRMLTIFGAMSVALVMIIERPWWDKLLILLSAVPIALVSNVVRIVTTGLLFLAFGQETVWLNTLIHDWAG
ncbi:MAG TPA: exosortase/archaeosortase family protein, partial [Lacipirellulaceae bacterium]|nr:exosortase/archaeosortase family protein [Lacipirellulaceae bacterium]